MSASISQQTRERLEQEAVRTGLSISQIADRWLTQASEGQAQYLDRFGGSAALAAAAEALVAIAAAVDAQAIDAEAKRTALLTAWAEALPRLIPPAPPTQAGLADAMDAFNIWSACDQVLMVVRDAGEADPVNLRAREPLSGAALLGRPPIYQILLGAGRSLPDENVLQALEILKGAGDTAQDEIARALDVLKPFLARETDRLAKQRDAEQMGHVIAGAITGRTR